MKREKLAILPDLYDFGGVIDPKKKWYVYYSVRNPRNGKMVRFKVYTGLNSSKSPEERYRVAKQIIHELSLKLQLGWNPLVDDGKNMYADQLQYKFAARIHVERRAENRTINTFINQYLKSRLSGLDANTISTYTSKYRVFQMWCNREGLGENDITAFDNKVIVAFFNYLNNERESSHVTYKKYKQLLDGLFEYIVEEGMLPFNPVQKLPKCTRVIEKAPSPIADEDVLKFIRRIKADRQMYLFVLFEYYCLMRPGEIRMMKIGWINWGRKVVMIPKEHSKTRMSKMPIIPDEFILLLRDEFALHNFEKDWYVIGKYGQPGPECLGKNTMRYRFNKIRDELKMPQDYMLYSWKHTANVRLEANNFSVVERMMQNGHTSIVTTEKYTKKKIGYSSPKIQHEYPSIE